MSNAALLLIVFCGSTAAAQQNRLEETIGKYRIQLRQPSGGLYAGEEMEIELRLEDTSRSGSLTGFSPVIRAAVEAQIDMPEMPGMPRYRETAHPEAVPGEYGFHPTFAHGGQYRLRLSIAPPRDQTIEVQFALNVLDAAEGAKLPIHPPRYSMEISTTPKHPKAGESVDLRLVLRDRESPKSILSALEIQHEALMHLVIVRNDLSNFAHEHPALGSEGAFHLRYTFPAAGEYHLFADVAPLGAGSQVLRATVKVTGNPGETFDVRRAWNSQPPHGQTIGQTTFELVSPQDPFPIRKTNTVTIRVTDTGAPIRDFEPYLGAPGHFLLVHEDATTFVHSHPSEPQHDGLLKFLARFPKAGLYRGWVQIKRNGEVVTADLILRAEATM